VLQQVLLLQVVGKVAQHVQDGLIHCNKGQRGVTYLGHGGTISW
jgi:hypothetical protein